MNILVTGGAGYIGSHTAITLSEAGHKVVIYDNLCNSSELILGHLERVLGNALPFIKGDIRDKNLLEKTLCEHKINAVVHFAGLKSVADSVKDPLGYFDNNVLGSIQLLEAMNNVGVRIMVFSSSATVYGEPHYLPYDETHPTNPINPYGRTKLQVEEILKAISESDSTWRVGILRYFNPVGAHDSGLIGENPKGIPNNLMPYLTLVAAGKLPALNIYGNDYSTKDGTCERDYIHVVDLAEGHLAALNFLNDHSGCHIFNLGSGAPVSVLELVTSFEKVSGINLPYQFVERRLGDLPRYYALTIKANNLLNWKAHSDLEEICTSAWLWQQKLNLNE
jgi:UDP-glucose 4-epimerase